MNKNAIRCISDSEAQVTKAFEKMAVVFGTEEYKLWIIVAKRSKSTILLLLFIITL
jgi:hypothetical protein